MVEFPNPKATRTKNETMENFTPTRKTMGRLHVEGICRIWLETFLDDSLSNNFCRTTSQTCWHSFLNNFLPLEKPDHLTEPLWLVRESEPLVHRLNSNRSGDHIGLVAEMSRYRTVFSTTVYRVLGISLGSWCWRNHNRQSYQLISKPIAIIRLLRMFFYYNFVAQWQYVGSDATWRATRFLQRYTDWENAWRLRTL